MGYFSDSRKNGTNGNGIITTPDGCKYEGKFKNDKANGYGKIIFTNGDVP